MALLMLFSAVPVEAAALFVSENEVRVPMAQPRAGGDTAFAITENAIRTNPEDGRVTISLDRLNEDEVYAGEVVPYRLSYNFGQAPNYREELSGQILPTYSQYKTVAITITPPKDFVIVNDAGEVLGTADKPYVHLMENVGTGLQGNLPISGKSLRNGVAVAGERFGALKVAVEAKVDVTDVNLNETREMVFESANIPVDTAATNVTAKTRDTQYDVKKSAGARAEEFTEGGVTYVKLTYPIQFGLSVNGSITDSKNEYLVPGFLGFNPEATFTLKDVLPKIAESGTHQTDVLPAAASLLLNGQKVAGYALGEEKKAEISTDRYNTLDVSDSDLFGIVKAVPYFTEYVAEVVYPKAELTRRYGDLSFQNPKTNTEEDVKQLFNMTNTVTASYTRVDKATATVVESSAVITKKYEEMAAKIQIKQLIEVNGGKQEYKLNYQSIFPGAAYALYKADEFDTATGKPKPGAVPVLNRTFENVASPYLETGIAPEADIAAGDYIALQTVKPDNTEDLPVVWQRVTALANQTVTVEFVNKALPQKGILILKKLNAAGNALAGAGFTLYQKNGDALGNAVGEEQMTDNAGQVVMFAPPGEYFLRETTVPAGKVRMQNTVVTLEEGKVNQTLLQSPIINRDNDADLTIRKFVVVHVDANHTPTGKPQTPNVQNFAGADSVRFTLERTAEQIIGESTQWEVVSNDVALSQNGAVTLNTAGMPGLVRANDEGVYYTYRLTENEPSAEAAFTRDPWVYQWQFNQNKTYTAEFYNKLISRLKMKKVQITLDDAGNQKTENRKDVRFHLYQKVGTAFEAVVQDGQPVVILSDAEGVVLSPRLRIRDEAGNPISYYVQEAAEDLAGFVLTDKDGAAPKEQGYFGPMLLNAQAVTDYTANPIQNRENTGLLRVNKVSTKALNKKLAGAKFQVYTLENGVETYFKDAQGAVRTFETVENGDTLIKVPQGKTYFVKEIEAPAGFMLNSQPVQAALPNAPLAVATAQVRDLPLPTLRAQKLAISPVTGGVVSENAQGLVFELYTKENGVYSPALDKDGQQIKLTTAANGYSAPVVIADYSKDYYVKETNVDDRFIKPGQPGGLVKGAFSGVAGAQADLIKEGDDYYAGPVNLSRGGDVTFQWRNTVNRGTLTLNKTDAKTKEPVAGFEADVFIQTQDQAVIARLSKVGFAQKDGVWSKHVVAGGASEAVSGLPMLDSQGVQLQYQYIETKAPEGYHLDPAYTVDGDLTQADAAKAQTTQFDVTQPKGGAQTGVFANPKKVSFSFTKYGFSEYEEKNASGIRLLYQLKGAGFALYRIGADGKLQFIEEKVQDSSADFTFENLLATEAYVVVETVVPENHRIVNGAPLAPANALHGKDRSALNGYNHLEHSFANDKDNKDFKASVSQANNVANGSPYWQLAVTKWLSRGGNDKAQKLNLARFELYGMPRTEWEAQGSPQEPPASVANGNPLEKNMESGMIRDGEFATKRLAANMVYWLREVEPAPNTKMRREWDGPHLYEDGYRNTFKPVDIINDPVIVEDDVPPQGFQMKLRKVLYSINENDGSEKREDLAGATFEVWLTDASFTDRVEKMGELTTGINRDIEELRGTGLTGYKIIGDAWMNEHPGLVTKNADGTYTFNVLLVETVYPFKTSPRNGGVYPYTYTTKALDLGMSHVDTHFWGDTVLSEKNVVNDGGLSYPVTVIKKAYDAKTGKAAAVPLAGARIGLIRDDKPNMVREGITNQKGEVRFFVRTDKTFTIKELEAPEGYEISTEEIKLDQQVNVPDPELEPFVIYDRALRKLVIDKKDANGNAVGNVQFTVTHRDNEPILDGNNKERPQDYGVVTTAANGKTPALMLRGEGSYILTEDSVNGKPVTAREHEYFLLANPDKVPFTFGAEEAEKTLELVNPGMGELTITKTDNHGVPMQDVQFTLTWKPFGLASGFAKPNGSYGNPEGMNAPLTGKTNAQGVLKLENLLPGWYKVEEAVPQGYLATPNTWEMPVYGKQLGGDKTGVNKLAVTNVPLAQLTLKKQFVRLDQEAFPLEQTFTVYKNAQGTQAADVYTDNLGKKNAAGAVVKVAIDPNTGLGETTVWLPIYQVGGNADTAYYVREAEDDTFLNRTANLEANGLLKVVLNKAAVQTPAVGAFTNISRWGKVEITKVNTQGQPLEGAEFAVKDSATGLYYHETPDGKDGVWKVEAFGAKTWVSDEQGKITMRIKLPKDRQDTHSLTLEEIQAPVGYVLSPAEGNLNVEAKNQQTVDKRVENVRGITIRVHKHGMPKRHVTEQTPYNLAQASFEVYLVDGNKATKAADAKTTDVNGQVVFDNLPKLKDGQYYAIKEGEMAGFLTALATAEVGGVEVAAREVDGHRLFKVATNEDTVKADVYNTPAGRIYLFKYDIAAPQTPPEGMTFTVTREGDAAFHLTGAVGKVQASEVYPNVLNLDSRYLMDNGTYTDDAGVHYTAGVLDNLTPGTYHITEVFGEKYLEKYFYPKTTTANDAWYRTRTVTVDDRGTHKAAVFGNLPFGILPEPQIAKTAVKTGTDENALESLLAGERLMTYTLSGIPMKDAEYSIPLTSVTVTDNKPQFMDANANGTAVSKGISYEIRKVTIGAAGYKTSILHPDNAPTDAIIARLYGVPVGGGEPVKIQEYSVKDRAQTVNLAQMAAKYEGIKVVYTGENGAALQGGFYAGNIVMETAMKQTADPTMGEVVKVVNKADVSVAYSLVENHGATLNKSATVETPVHSEEIVPRATIQKQGVLVVGTNEYSVGDPGASYQYVTPGMELKYTVTVKNTSLQEADILDPTVLDVLPDLFEPDMGRIQAQGTGLTLTDTGRTDNKVYLQFEGALPKDGTILVTIPGVVKTTAYDAAANKLTNEAYLISRHRIAQTAGNPTGASFQNNNGGLPEYTVPAADVGMAGDPYRGIRAEQSFAFKTAMNVQIFKTGKGNLGDKFIGAEGFTMASPSDKDHPDVGVIRYEVAVVNNSQSVLEKLRIIDVLPHVGDKSVHPSDDRLSKWAATLVSVHAPDAKVYSSQSATPVKGDLTTRGAFATVWQEGVTAGAASIMVELNRTVQAGETYKFTVTAKAPDVAAAEEVYFLQSNNNATMAFGYNTTTYATSNIVKVTLVPATTNVGNRVWVDLDGNGKQDGGTEENAVEPNYVEDGITMTLRTYENGGVIGSSVAKVQNGTYTFTDLVTAAKKEEVASEDALYDAKGNVDQKLLRGAMRRTYVIQAAGLPAGFVPSPAFAGSTTGVQKRAAADDSNFTQGDMGLATETFYLTTGEPDMRKDLGLVPVRNIKVTKMVDTYDHRLQGTVFGIYGPFDSLDGAALSRDNRLFEMTTDEHGEAVFTSATEHMLLRAKHYVVVEENSGNKFANKAGLTVAGNAVVQPSEFKPTGDMIVGTNYFGLTKGTLEKPGDIDVNIAAVNTYAATGELVVEATKALKGRALRDDDFTFVITSEDHPNFTPMESKNKQDGTVLFALLAYTEKDIGKTYHYRMAEKAASEKGMVYDKTVGTFSVSVADAGKQDQARMGELEVTVNETFEQTAAGHPRIHAFNNELLGDLTVKKVVKGNGGDSAKAFRFEVTLDYLANEGKTTLPVTDSLGVLTALDFVNGKASFDLKHNQTVTIQGILADANYTVTEQDYAADGYVTQKTNDSGTLTADGKTAVFTNTRTLRGEVTVQKHIAGNGATAHGREDKAYRFTLDFAPFTNFDGTFDANGTHTVTRTDKDNATSTEQLTVQDNRAVITLKHDEKLTIPGLYQGIKVKVTEDDYRAEGYTTQGSGTEVTVGKQAKTVTVTNTRAIGEVKVAKTIQGNGAHADDAFTFTLTLQTPDGMTADRTYPMLDGEGNIGTLNVTNGQATIVLKGGQSLTVQDVIAGTKATVTEGESYLSADYGENRNLANMGYVVAPQSRTHALTVLENQTHEAGFLNARHVGSFKLSKAVEGNAAHPEDVFTFVITMAHDDMADLNRAYPTVDANGTAGTLTFANGQATVTMRHGDSLTINDVVAGTKVTAVEQDAYLSRQHGAQSLAYMGYLSNQPNRTVQHTVQAEAEGRADFFNTRETGTLAVAKTVGGNRGDQKKLFTFVITVINPDGTPNTRALPYTGVNRKSGLMQFNNGVARFTLMHDQALKIDDILVNSAVSVKEEEADQGGYITTVVGEPAFTMPQNPDERDKALAYTNIRNEYGSLVISKTLMGNAADKDKAFQFTVTLTNEDGTPFDGALPLLLGGRKGEIAFAKGQATVLIKGGQSAVIGPMLTGTTYRVEEEKTNYIMNTVGDTGTVAENNKVYTAAFTNTYNTAALTLRKELEAGNHDQQSFAFVVSLAYDGKPVNGKVAVRGKEPIELKDGKATLTLRGGQSVTLEALQTDLGLTYDVRELDSRNYTPVYSNAQGLLKGDTTVVVGNVLVGDPMGLGLAMNEGDCFN